MHAVRLLIFNGMNIHIFIEKVTGANKPKSGTASSRPEMHWWQKHHFLEGFEQLNKL